MQGVVTTISTVLTAAIGIVTGIQQLLLRYKSVKGYG